MKKRSIHEWKKSIILNKLLKKEIKTTFQDIEEYIDYLLETKTISELINDYDTLVQKYSLDESRFIIPIDKSYDEVINQIENNYSNDEIVIWFYKVIRSHFEKHSLSTKESAKNVMLRIHRDIMNGNSFWQSLIRLWQEYWVNFILSDLEKFSDSTIEWLYLVWSLQERHYSKNEIHRWNNEIQNNIKLRNAIKLNHYVLYKYLVDYCSHNSNRYNYTFHPLQEICTYAGWDIIPNDKFLKIIANNIWPSLLENELNISTIEKWVDASVKKWKIFEQFIFWIIKIDQLNTVAHVEPKSCPAKKLVHDSSRSILPLLFK